jgi:hypothetical protein
MNNTVNRNSDCWISAKMANQITGLSMRTIQRNCKNKYKVRIANELTRGGNSGKVFEISLSSLPVDAQLKYYKTLDNAELKQTTSEKEIIHDSGSQTQQISTMKNFQRDHALAWLDILKKTEGMTYKQLEEFCRIQKLEQPDLKICVSLVYAKRAAYKNLGIVGISPLWGQARKGTSKIPEIAFERFVRLFFTERGPGVKACHFETFGYMKSQKPNLEWKEFPRPSAFYRLLKSRYTQSEIDYRRKGKQWWNRRHAKFIRRDWTALQPNQILVADDHLLDLMVIANNGKIIRPWLNLFLCLRTHRAQGWLLTENAPCTDTVFHSFALSCIENGIPSEIMLDNGKNFKAFSAINKYRPWDDQQQKIARSLLGVLGVEVSFCKAWAPQSKPIEPRFKILIENYCKKLPGYCGSSSLSKPDILKETLKKGQLLTFKQCKEQIDIFFRDLYNNLKSEGRLLRGLSANQLYNSLPKTIRKVTPDGINFLFMRTSDEFTIKREGIVDKSLGIDLVYWCEAFYGLTGMKVFLRRDLNAYNEAWVYNASTNTYICKAELANSIPGRANTPIQKQALVTAIKENNESLKRIRESTRTKPILDSYEILKNSILGVQAESACTEVKKAPNKQIEIISTPHDIAIREYRKQEKIGTFDLSKIAPPPREKKPPIFAFPSEREAYEKEQLNRLGCNISEEERKAG